MIGSPLKYRRELYQLAAPSSETASPREFAELACEIAVMLGRERGALQLAAILRGIHLAYARMPERGIWSIKTRLKC
jgi:hypothetical protein